MHFLQSELKIPGRLLEAISNVLWETNAPNSTQVSIAGESLKKLWPLLAKDRGQIKSDEKHYSFDGKLTETYASYYWLSNVMKPAVILDELLFLGLKQPFAGNVVWTDVGCGPATVLGGLSSWFAERFSGIKFQYMGLDQSKNFTGIAKNISRKLQANAQFDILKKTTLDSLQSYIEKTDVLSFMNSIAEVSPDLTKRQNFIAEICKKMLESALKSGKRKWLVMIEPGSKVNSRELLSVREKIIGMEGVRILTPCLDNRECGAFKAEGEWCHEEVSIAYPEWHRKIGEIAGLKKESMLFSYLVVAFGDEDSLPKLEVSGCARVVSQRLQEKGLTRCFICNSEGRVQARVLHSKTSAQTESFLKTTRGKIYKKIITDEKSNVIELEEYAIDFPTLQQDRRS